MSHINYAVAGATVVHRYNSQDTLIASKNMCSAAREGKIGYTTYIETDDFEKAYPQVLDRFNKNDIQYIDIIGVSKKDALLKIVYYEAKKRGLRVRIKTANGGYSSTRVFERRMGLSPEGTVGVPVAGQNN